MKEKLYEVCEEMLNNEEEAKKFLKYETLEELYECFLSKIPGLTKDEFEEFVCAALDRYVKEQENVEKIGENGLGDVSGGKMNVLQKLGASFFALTSLATSAGATNAQTPNTATAGNAQTVATAKASSAKTDQSLSGFQKVKAWIKNHPKLVIGGTFITAISIALGIYAYTHRDKDKDKKSTQPTPENPGGGGSGGTHDDHSDTEKMTKQELVERAMITFNQSWEKHKVVWNAKAQVYNWSDEEINRFAKRVITDFFETDHFGKAPEKETHEDIMERRKQINVANLKHFYYDSSGYFSNVAYLLGGADKTLAERFSNIVQSALIGEKEKMNSEELKTYTTKIVERLSVFKVSELTDLQKSMSSVGINMTSINARGALGAICRAIVSYYYNKKLEGKGTFANKLLNQWEQDHFGQKMNSPGYSVLESVFKNDKALDLLATFVKSKCDMANLL